jgi:hypothetical protein
MESINRHTIHQRIALVYDTAAGAQAQEKGIKGYVKALRAAVGLKDESAGDATDFLRDFGKGL